MTFADSMGLPPVSVTLALNFTGDAAASKVVGKIVSTISDSLSVKLLQGDLIVGYPSFLAVTCHV